MTTTTTAPPPAAPPPPPLSPRVEVERRIVLEGVSWSLYEQLLREVGDTNHLRLTFDEGRLEIMSPSPLHELVKTIVARLIEAYADATGTTVEGFGSTTFDREDLQKGLEPDECYYIANAAAVIGRRELDWAVDPPPDLAIEVDISPPDVARTPIYAALRVPEVWRHDGRRLVALHRAPDGNYVEAAASLAFPRLPMDELNRLIQLGLEKGQSAAVRAMREWVRSQGGQ